MAERTIVIIPPKYVDKSFQLKHLRVAAYCRVSNPTEEQATSLEAQLQYYADKIAENPLWTNAEVYGEAVTGRNIKECSEFKKLITKCRWHKVDLILTKSISRFGRNALDMIRSIRELQSLDVDIFFEQENIHSLDPNARIAIETHCAIAQRESESKSHDIKWGINRGLQDGTSGYLNFKCYGYRSDKEHGLVVEPNEAGIVQMIFNLRLQGYSFGGISSELAKMKILSPSGKPIWSRECIRKMLINEKYQGDALLQKTFIADIFTRQSKKNNGELPQYYVHDCHPAIIDHDTFGRVQEELARRSSLKKMTTSAKTELSKYSGKYVLTELLTCGNCGTPYRRVTWTQNGIKRIVWRCINRLEHGKTFCKDSWTLDESNIHAAVVSAMNEMYSTKTMRELLASSIAVAVADNEDGTSLPAIENKLVELHQRQLELLALATSAGAESTEYDEEMNSVTKERLTLIAKRTELEKNHVGTVDIDCRLDNIMKSIETVSGNILTFDDISVRQVVSDIKVLGKEKLLVRFKDGTEIEQIVGVLS